MSTELDCPVCDSTMSAKKADRRIAVMGSSVVVPVEFYVCSAHGEIFTQRQIEAAQASAVAKIMGGTP